MTNETRKVRQSRKRAEAEARQAAYDALTTTEKLSRAIRRGHRDTPEAKRLQAQQIKEATGR